ncbi:MAG TPA: divergent polysaccharide deacetylase family protein [Thermoanaerobaculia bacterium]|nr:divergent polysaccharide deacetylase family protein [Thermoanaerobaculia bacterium]
MSARRRRVSAATVFFFGLSLALGIALYLKSRPSPAPSPRHTAAPSPSPVVSPSPHRPAAPPAASARIAIIIDDLGNDRAAVELLAGWREPVACAVLPMLPGSVAAAETLSRSGKEVLLHLPMEPKGFPGVRPGPGLVLVSQTDAEIRSTLAEDLDSVPHATGVNNHMGSLATADRRVMQVVAGELARRGLFFVDSRTTELTVAVEAAVRARVPSASRRVFLDDVQTVEAVERSLDDLVAKAKAEGSAIAIGHPHPVTLEVLGRELPRIGERRVRLVRVSELVR